MVPALLYLLFKGLKHQDWSKLKKNFVSKLLIRRTQIIITLMILLLLISFVLSAQKQIRSYKVIRKGDEIGWVNLEKMVDSNTTTISMASEIEVSFLFTFSSVAKEMSVFRDGKLNHSYFYRKTNGNVKADRHTRLAGDSYEVENKSGKKKLNIIPVAFNTLCLYFQEPVSLKQVYSDNCQCNIDIEKKSDGAYRVSLPDGGTNSFYYNNGVCNRVKIDYSFYSATLILK